eukprot:COSAG02_NODE_2695_length_8214_cov_12.071842_8_plen_176_part_00
MHASSPALGLPPMLCLAVWTVCSELARAQETSVLTRPALYESVPEDEQLSETAASWRVVQIVIVPAFLVGSFLVCLLGELVSRGGVSGTCGQRSNAKLWRPQLYESHLSARRAGAPGVAPANSNHPRQGEQQPIVDPEAGAAGHSPARGSELEQLRLPKATTHPQQPAEEARAYT